MKSVSAQEGFTSYLEGYVLETLSERNQWIIEETYLNFAVQENKDPRRSANDFLQRYVFSDVYEILFGSIHIELHQWLSRLIERKTNFQEG